MVISFSDEVMKRFYYTVSVMMNFNLCIYLCILWSASVVYVCFCGWMRLMHQVIRV